MTTSGKSSSGRFFEDFSVGDVLRHATPRTVSEGDVAMHVALYGGRLAVHSSDMFAINMGFEAAPVDDLLVFHLVFGKTVADVSLNAIANLGYAGGRFGAVVYPGDTIAATSQVIGVRETSNGKSGVVWVRTTGINQRDEIVLEYVRWVLVRKRDNKAPPPTTVVPDLPEAVAAADLSAPEGITCAGYDCGLAGSENLWEDYQIGERIDHQGGTTVEESEHMMAARLYQNSAKVHFNAHAEKDGRFARRIVYGGHVISIARALSFNGLENAFKIAAINGGRHVAPTFAGDTIYAWSEVVDKAPLAGRDDLAALRIRTRATKDCPCADFPGFDPGDGDDPAVVLDFDYWVLMPTRHI